MCLIVVAHRASERFPLIIAANRDEDYERPTRSAHRWDDAPNVAGGRDVLHGGSWLAVTREGRVAAVTNLRGSAARPDARSRGLLVRDFVLSDAEPLAYAQAVRVGDYAGFHFIAGRIGGTFVHLSDQWGAGVLAGAHRRGRRCPTEIDHGVFGVGNDPLDIRSERIEGAVEHVREAMRISDPAALADDLMAFLGRGSAFVAGDRYGTRSSTAIIATGGEMLFVERSYARGGVRGGDYSLAFPMCGDSMSSTSSSAP